MIPSEKYGELVDYILHEQKDSDRVKTEDWINASEKNRKYFREVQRKTLFFKWSLSSEELNTKEELLKFRRRIYKKKNYRLGFFIAASVLLVMGFSLFLLLSPDRNNSSILASNHNIKYGEKGGRLILSTGEEVLLGHKFEEVEENGGVKIHMDDEDGIKYGASSPSKTVEKAAFNTLRIPLGNEYSVTLSDGTKVWLNAGSELRYPVQFMGEKREVYLEGEGYFEVAHNADCKFIVHARKQDVAVYGTSFCVNAYEKDKVETTLVSGIVRLGIYGKDEEVELKPGEHAVTDLTNGVVFVNKVNTGTYTAWKDGDFVFEDESLENIMLRVKRWYDVDVFYADKEAKKIHFTGNMKRYSNISDLLYFIQATSDAKFEINGNTVIVK